jgi:hypothetical protein
MIRRVGPYSTLITHQAGSLFHAVFQDVAQDADAAVVGERGVRHLLNKCQVVGEVSLSTSVSVARNQMPVPPRRLPASGPAKNSSPSRWARVGLTGRMAEISAGSNSSPAKRKVTKALRSVLASVFVVEVAKRLVLLIVYRTIAIYDQASGAGKVARRLDLVQRAAEVPRFHAGRAGDGIRRIAGIAPQDAPMGASQECRRSRWRAAPMVGFARVRRRHKDLDCACLDHYLLMLKERKNLMRLFLKLYRYSLRCWRKFPACNKKSL